MNGIEMSERDSKGKFYENFLQIRHEILGDLEKELNERERKFWDEVDMQIQILERRYGKMERH